MEMIQVQDILSSSPSAIGEFNLKHTYNWLLRRGSTETQPQIPWSSIWKLPCLLKVWFHIWFLTRNTSHRMSFIINKSFPLIVAPYAERKAIIFTYMKIAMRLNQHKNNLEFILIRCIKLYLWSKPWCNSNNFPYQDMEYVDCKE